MRRGAAEGGDVPDRCQAVKSSTKGLGLDVYTAAAQKPEGEITEVNYLSLKPGDDPKGWAPKVSFVTRVGDLGCGVGYYK
jgi:hypothetical protein